MFQFWLTRVLVLLIIFLVVGTTEARQLDRQQILAHRLAAVQRWKPTFVSASTRTTAPKNITFSNPKASRMWLSLRISLESSCKADFGVEFYVDGKTIPEVDFDVGPSWSGLLPISGNKNETRKVNSDVAMQFFQLS